MDRLSRFAAVVIVAFLSATYTVPGILAAVVVSDIIRFSGHTANVMTTDVDGEILYTGSSDKRVAKWNITTQQLLMNYTFHTDTVMAVKILAGSLWSVGMDKNIVRWNAATGAVVYNVTAQAQTTGFAGNSTVFWISDYGGAAAYRVSDGVRLWSYRTGTPCTCVAYNNAEVFFGCWDYKVYRVNSSTGALLSQFTNHTKAISSLYANSTHLYSGAEDNSLMIYLRSTGELLDTYSSIATRITGTGFIVPGGGKVVTSDYSGYLMFWENRNTTSPAASIRVGGTNPNWGYCDDGTRVFVGNGYYAYGVRYDPQPTIIPTTTTIPPTTVPPTTVAPTTIPTTTTIPPTTTVVPSTVPPTTVAPTTTTTVAPTTVPPTTIQTTTTTVEPTTLPPTTVATTTTTIIPTTLPPTTLATTTTTVIPTTLPPTTIATTTTTIAQTTVPTTITTIASRTTVGPGTSSTDAVASIVTSGEAASSNAAPVWIYGALGGGFAAILLAIGVIIKRRHVVRQRNFKIAMSRYDASSINSGEGASRSRGNTFDGRSFTEHSNADTASFYTASGTVALPSSYAQDVSNQSASLHYLLGLKNGNTSANHLVRRSYNSPADEPANDPLRHVTNYEAYVQGLTAFSFPTTVGNGTEIFTNMFTGGPTAMSQQSYMPTTVSSGSSSPTSTIGIGIYSNAPPGASSSSNQIQTFGDILNVMNQQKEKGTS